MDRAAILNNVDRQTLIKSLILLGKLSFEQFEKYTRFLDQPTKPYFKELALAEFCFLLICQELLGSVKFLQYIRQYSDRQTPLDVFSVSFSVDDRVLNE